MSSGLVASAIDLTRSRFEKATLYFSSSSILSVSSPSELFLKCAGDDSAAKLMLPVCQQSLFYLLLCRSQ